MSCVASHPSLDEAFERIEETILPSLAAMIDTLLETASLARAGADADSYAGELRGLADELASLTRQVETLSAPAEAQAYRISAA
jgi:hypothetical protein